MIARAQQKERTCIATRQNKPVGELLRFVRGPDGALIFDVKARLPGRGVWVSATRSDVGHALKKGLFKRALKSEIEIDPDLLASVERQLRSTALGRLGLARKAGQIIPGFASVEAALRKGGVAALIHASDCAEDGRRKLQNVVRGLDLDRQPAETVRIFTANELSLALGRANVIHAAAITGHASEMFIERARLVANFCADGADVSLEHRTEKLEPHLREAAF